MYDAVMRYAPGSDIIIKAAAVADYRPASVADNKLKKGEVELSIPLERTTDILAALGAEKKAGQFLCGFSMETDNMLENSQKKLVSKKVDMICANSLRQAGAGFGTDTNILTLITKDNIQELELMSKEDAGHRIFDTILNIMQK
jgi:phosphopantothenoylcysteine decarboxylase/phosphopantothenate--cysteine ligase